MNIADPEKALSLVEEFRTFLIGNEAVYDQSGSDAAISHETHQKLLRGVPWIQKIEAAVNHEAGAGVGVAYGGMWSWLGWPRRVEMLIGILSRWNDHEAIFAPAGPLLSVGQLHPWVRDAAVNLWHGGHHGPAVHEASRAVEQQAQLKLGRHDLDGKDLYAKAFSTKAPLSGEPRLRLHGTDHAKGPKAWTSAHEGAMHFGMGCAQGIRNPRAHPSEDISEQEAVEQLAALSVLARWVEAATLDSA